MQAHPYAAECVRRLDKDRYLAGLFAPAKARPHVYALLAFSAEIARVRDVVSDPLPGEMRLQWWHDLLAGEVRGEASANPIAAALLGTIEAFRLPRDALTRLIEARSFDLYDDPMPTLNDLEGYCGETASALFQLSAIVLADGRDPETAEIAGHAGVAWAITGLLRSLGFHAARGQVYMPEDVLARHGATPADILAGRATPGLTAALAAIRDVARRHLDRTRALIGTVPLECAPAFLPLSLVEPYLGLMEQPGYDPFRSVIDLPQWRKQWILWRSARLAQRRIGAGDAFGRHGLGRAAE